MYANPAPPPAAWWGTAVLPPGTARRWRIGPFELHLWLVQSELRVRTWNHGDPLDPNLDCARPTETWDREVGPGPRQPAWTRETRFRVALKDPGAGVVLRPKMPDRAVIAGPREPLIVAPRQRVTVYVSVPLWIEAVDPASRAILFERPLYRPSDSWFGSSTTEGELAYASRTTARLHPDALVLLPHRAISAVEIHNADSQSLAFERLRIPAPELAIYADSQGRMYTERIVLGRRGGDSEAEVKIEPGAPPGMDTAERISEARQTPTRGKRWPSFGAILRVGGEHV